MALSEKAGVTSSVARKVAATELRKHGIETRMSQTTMKRFSASRRGALRLGTSLSTTPQERLDSTSRVVPEKEKDVLGISVLFPEEKRGLCSAFLLQRSRATLTLATSSETASRREGSTAAPPKKELLLPRSALRQGACTVLVAMLWTLAPATET